MVHKRLLSMADGQAAATKEAEFVEEAPPIWEQLVALCESAPAGTWDHVPADLSKRIDDLLYRRGQEGRRASKGSHDDHQ